MLERIEAQSRRGDMIERLFHRAKTMGISYRPASTGTGQQRSRGQQYQLQVIVSRDEIASDNDVVLTKGMRHDSEILTNKAIFKDHWYEMEAGIGSLRFPTLAKPTETIRDIGGGRQALHATVALLGTRRGIMDPRDIVEMANHGILGWSIGWTTEEGRDATEDDKSLYGNGLRFVHTSWDWRELSATLFPCLISARTLAVIESDDTQERMAAAESLLTAGRIAPESLAAVAGHRVQTAVSLAPRPVSLAPRAVSLAG